MTQVTSLNEKKSYLSAFRETLPFEEKKQLIFEITQAQGSIEKVERLLFNKKEDQIDTGRSEPVILNIS